MLLDYFFTPKIPSFAAVATRNLTTVLAGILIFCCVFGLKPVRAFLFCFTSLPKPGRTNSLKENLPLEPDPFFRLCRNHLAIIGVIPFDQLGNEQGSIQL